MQWICDTAIKSATKIGLRSSETDGIFQQRAGDTIIPCLDRIYSQAIAVITVSIAEKNTHIMSEIVQQMRKMIGR